METEWDIEARNHNRLEKNTPFGWIEQIETRGRRAYRQNQ
jgi:hypothetical protein